MNHMTRDKKISINRFDKNVIYTKTGIDKNTYTDIEKSNKKKGSNYQYVKASFALRLTDCLETVLLTDAAKSMDIPKGSLSEYRSGKMEPRISTLAKIAEEFDVSADYLLGMTNTKSTEPTKKSACEYTGLSDTAAEILYKGKRDKKHPLYSDILSYLIETKTLDRLILLLEHSLIQQKQYDILYKKEVDEEPDEQHQNTLATLEYQFNRQLSDMYSKVTTELSEQKADRISYISKLKLLDLVEAAVETKEKMEVIIEEILDDPDVFEKFNKKYSNN